MRQHILMSALCFCAMAGRSNFVLAIDLDSADTAPGENAAAAVLAPSELRDAEPRALPTPAERFASWYTDASPADGFMPMLEACIEPVELLGADSRDVCPCRADLNGDGVVDGFDRLLLQGLIGCTVGIGDILCDRADVNCDGLVDNNDDLALDCQLLGGSPDECCDPDPGCASDADCPNDNNACTRAFCNAVGQCEDQLLQGTPCDDGDICTAGSACDDGVCIPGQPLPGCEPPCITDADCPDDGNPCTLEFCGPDATGGALVCQVDPISGGSCEDGNPCSLGDSCDDGVCIPGQVIDPNCPRVCECDGDANGDGGTDQADETFVLIRGGCAVGVGDKACDSSDVNCDGVVDDRDVESVICLLTGGSPDQCCEQPTCQTDADCLDDGNPCTLEFCEPSLSARGFAGARWWKARPATTTTAMHAPSGFA